MLHPFVKVADLGVIQGKGLVATGFIRQGEIVSTLEPDQPMYRIADVQSWPQAEQDKLLHYAYQCSATHLVNEQGDERFMNHACDPNTWWADNDTMIARRNIQPGEELTYDYATTEITIPYEMPCTCGSSNCRGLVTNQDYLDPNWQKIYGEHLPDYTLACIREVQNGR